MATILENFKYKEIELIKASNDILKGYGVLVKENYKDYPTIWRNNPLDTNIVGSYLPILDVIDNTFKISKLQEVINYDNTNNRIKVSAYPWHDHFTNFKEFFYLTNYLDRDLINLVSYIEADNDESLVNLNKIHISIKTVDEKESDETKSEDNTSSDLINFEEVLYQQKYSTENFAESETKYNKEYLLTNILLAGSVLSSIGFITSKLLLK